MQAIIFAAGKSTRTFPLTVNKPKPLLKIANTSLIEHNLQQIKSFTDEVIIIVGYMGNKIKESLGDNYRGLKIRYVEQQEQKGNGHALLLCKSLVKGRFMVVNGDDLISGNDIKKCITKDYCVLGKKVKDLSKFGELYIQKGVLKKIVEKPSHNNEGLANTGFFILDKDIFDLNIKLSSRGEYEITDLINEYAQSHSIQVLNVMDYWIPITYPWSLIEANELLLTKLIPKNAAQVEKGATIKGTVSIGKNTIVKSGAYIEGPVIIGNNCSVGPNCFVRAFTSIGDNTKIGNAVEIKNSIVGEKTSIGHLSYIGDSVIGDEVNIGAGTITANLRHDNQNISSIIKGQLITSNRRKLGAIIGDKVHTGIHTSIYPGRNIWPEKTTLPGAIITKDVT